MTKVIAIFVIVLVVFGGYKLYDHYKTFETDEKAGMTEPAETEVHPQSLQGMPYQLEAALEAASKQGAKGLQDFLVRFQKQLADPRKAWIELDLVVLLGSSKPAEAKELFQRIKERTPASSPVYPRIRRLSATYN